MADAKEKKLHEGHRERMRTRFETQGLDGFTEAEVLELLLYYAIPRRDVNELAHRLIMRFGSLAGVFDARMDELSEVEGIGKNAAVLIKLIPQISRKNQLSRNDREKNTVLDTVEKAGRFFVPYFHMADGELVYMACLNPKGRLLSCRELAKGSAAMAMVSLRSIIETAVKANAFSVILAHNHPDGTVIPSREDVRATKLIEEGLRSVDIRLEDHIIVTDNDFSSMSECGFFEKS